MSVPVTDVTPETMQEPHTTGLPLVTVSRRYSQNPPNPRGLTVT